MFVWLGCGIGQEVLVNGQWPGGALVDLRNAWGRNFDAGEHHNQQQWPIPQTDQQPEQAHPASGNAFSRRGSLTSSGFFSNIPLMHCGEKGKGNALTAPGLFPHRSG
jgi:hypothetical protein